MARLPPQHILQVVVIAYPVFASVPDDMSNLLLTQIN